MLAFSVTGKVLWKIHVISPNSSSSALRPASPRIEASPTMKSCQV